MSERHSFRQMSSRSESLAAYVRAMREGRGWPQQELAERAGISKSTVMRIETGENPNPRPDIVRGLWAAFGLIDPENRKKPLSRWDLSKGAPQRIGRLPIRSYDLPSDNLIERRGEDAWAVTDDAGNVLNRNGEWEHEPRPSERSNDFIARTRYRSAQSALDAWHSRRPEVE